VGTVLGYIIALLVVGGLLFLAASYAFGRGEEMSPVLPEGTPVELPDDRLADGDDLRALRLTVAVRGYRMDEVDWLLDRLSEQVDTRDREIARLRSVLHVEPVDTATEEPELLTHPFPPVRDASDPDRNGRPERRAGVGTETDTRPADRDATGADGRRPDADPAGDEAWRRRAVPEGTTDTGARPDRPARHVRTDDGPARHVRTGDGPARPVRADDGADPE
jgi:DivIVA domain-containing protein